MAGPTAANCAPFGNKAFPRNKVQFSLLRKRQTSNVLGNLAGKLEHSKSPGSSGNKAGKQGKGVPLRERRYCVDRASSRPHDHSVRQKG